MTILESRFTDSQTRCNLAIFIKIPRRNKSLTHILYNYQSQQIDYAPSPAMSSTYFILATNNMTVII